MARMRERVFAGFGALLFLGSACALTIFVILDPGSGTSTNNTTNQSSQQTCSDTSTSEPTLPVPDAYTTGTVSSLQTTDLTAGTGQTAKSGDCLVMKYYGTLAADGTKFDENFTTGSAFAFTLGQGQVIQGWDKGLVGMKVGGTRRLVIPSAEAYGATGSCKTYDPSNSSKCDAYAIPPNSDLVFVVKLLRIQNS